MCNSERREISFYGRKGDKGKIILHMQGREHAHRLQGQRCTCAVIHEVNAAVDECKF